MAVEPSEAGFINVFAIIIAIFSYLRYKKRKYIIATMLLFAIQLVIGNTASLIAGLAAIFVSFLDYARRRYNNILSKILIYLMAILAVLFSVNYALNNTHILDKVTNYQYYLDTRGSSVAERLATINTCFAMFLQRPILGIGFGNFGWYLDKFCTSPYLVYVAGGKFQPNNLYFQILAELGIVGISIYFILIFRILKKINLELNKEERYGFANMLLAMIFYLLIHNFTLTTLFSFQFWILIACVSSYEKGLEKIST